MSGLLVLVPTDLELSKLQPLLGDRVAQAGGILRTCGFGPISSGIRTMQLLAECRPTAVVLVGIAGAYGGDLAVGTAATFSRFACYGIGAGSGPSFRTAGELGWPQLIDRKSGLSYGEIIPPPRESRSTEPDAGGAGRTLLTVCAASDSADDVDDRLRRFPDAAAEDMEAYSVAMACGMAAVPLKVVRGISNRAGDRNKANWDITAALDAAAELVISGFGS